MFPVNGSTNDPMNMALLLGVGRIKWGLNPRAWHESAIDLKAGAKSPSNVVGLTYVLFKYYCLSLICYFVGAVLYVTGPTTLLIVPYGW